MPAIPVRIRTYHADDGRLLFDVADVTGFLRASAWGQRDASTRTDDTRRRLAFLGAGLALDQAADVFDAAAIEHVTYCHHGPPPIPDPAFGDPDRTIEAFRRQLNGE